MDWFGFGFEALILVSLLELQDFSFLEGSFNGKQKHLDFFWPIRSGSQL